MSPSLRSSQPMNCQPEISRSHCCNSQISTESTAPSHIHPGIVPSHNHPNSAPSHIHLDSLSPTHTGPIPMGPIHPAPTYTGSAVSFPHPHSVPSDMHPTNITPHTNPGSLRTLASAQPLTNHSLPYTTQATLLSTTRPHHVPFHADNSHIPNVHPLTFLPPEELPPPPPVEPQQQAQSCQHLCQCQSQPLYKEGYHTLSHQAAPTNPLSVITENVQKLLSPRRYQPAVHTVPTPCSQFEQVCCLLAS